MGSLARKGRLLTWGAWAERLLTVGVFFDSGASNKEAYGRGLVTNTRRGKCPSRCSMGRVKVPGRKNVREGRGMSHSFLDLCVTYIYLIS